MSLQLRKAATSSLQQVEIHNKTAGEIELVVEGSVHFCCSVALLICLLLPTLSLLLPTRFPSLLCRLLRTPLPLSL